MVQADTCFYNCYSDIELTETIMAIAMDLIVFAAVYYVGIKTDWFGEIRTL